MSVRRTVGVLGTSVLACVAMGCVDQEASLGMRGVVAFEGTRSIEETDCPPGADDAETRKKPVYECSESAEPGGVENFFTRATVDISEFEGSSGQLGPSATFVDDEFFCQEGATKYVNAKYAFKTFSLSFDMVNRLQDSRQVGAQSEGGGGGGFGGLGLDVNDIQMQEFILEFPNVGSASDLGLEKNRKFSMLAESGGGGAIFSVPIFESGDFPNLKTLHKQLVRERAGLQNYNQQARRTEISIIAEIYVKGETLGDRPIESNHIEFPITICGEGCGTTDRCVFREDSG